jgi:hypothetical protein
MTTSDDERLDAELARLRTGTESLAPTADPWLRLQHRLRSEARALSPIDAFVLSARRLLLIGGVAASLGVWTYHRAQARQADLILHLELDGRWQP